MMAGVAALATRAETRVRTLAILWMCLAVLLWAVMEEALPRFFARPYSPFQIVWARYATNVLFMLLVFAPRRGLKLARTNRLGWQLLRAATMIGMPLFFVLGVVRMPLNDALSIFWVAPLIVMGVAALWLRERVSWQQWLAALAGFVGALLILQPADLTRRAAVWLLGMALCFGLYLLMSRRLRDEDIYTSLFYTALGVLIPFSFGLPFFWQTPTIRDALVMMAIGLIGFGGLFAFDKAVELAPASAAAPFIFTQPVWAAVLHYLLTRSWPGGLTILGVLVIAASGLYLFWLNVSD